MQKTKKLLTTLVIVLCLVGISQATITNTEPSRKQYVTNGVTTNFPIPFDYLDPTHIAVQHIDAAGTTTPWVYNGGGATGFTIVSDEVVANVAPATGNLVVGSETPITQTVDYKRNRAVPAEIQEGALDKLTLISRELDTRLDRALLYALDYTGTVETAEEFKAAWEAAVDEAEDHAEDAEAAAQSVGVSIDNYEAVASVGQPTIDTGFFIARDLANVGVFIDGARLRESDISRLNDTTLLLVTPLVGGEEIEVLSASFKADATGEAIAAAAEAAQSAEDAVTNVQNVIDVFYQNNPHTLFPDHTATDQGVDETKETIAGIMADYGASGRVKIVLRAKNAATVTNYTISTSIDMSSYPDMVIVVEPGARLEGSGGATITLPHPRHLHVTGDQAVTSTDTLRFAIKGKVHPEWWGAIPDGVTECANSIQWAVDNGSHIEFNGGTYLISGQINVTNSNTLLAGNGAIIKTNFAGSSVFAVYGTIGGTHISFVTIEGFEFRKAIAHTSGSLFFIQAASNVIIRNILSESYATISTISDSAETDYSKNITFENCDFALNGSGVTPNFVVYSAETLKFVDNVFRGTDTTGETLVIEIGSTFGIASLVFRNNDCRDVRTVLKAFGAGILDSYITGNTMSGGEDTFYFSCANAPGMSNTIISNNVFRGKAGLASSTAIQLISSVSGFSKGVVISGNVFHDFATRSLNLYQNLADVTVIGNRFLDAGTINITVGTGLEGFSISGNVFDGDNNSSYGIEWLGPAGGGRVEGNNSFRNFLIAATVGTP